MLAAQAARDMRRLVSFFALLGCNHPTTETPEPDALPPDGAGAPPAMLVARGVAGTEALYFIDDGIDRLVSAMGGQPLCDGKVFCDAPPNPAATRFPFYDFLDAHHAIWLDADDSTIEAVDLDSGARTSLSAGVAWAPLVETRPSWVYAFARAGVETYWSLVTTTGYELFRSRGPAAPLERIAAVPFRAGDVPRESRVVVDGNAVAWSVGTMNGADWRNQAFLLDRDGTVRFGPTDLPTGFALCGRQTFLAGDTFVVGVYGVNGTCGSPTTIVVDVSTRATRQLAKSDGSFPIGLSRDGRTIFQQMDNTLVTFAAATGVATGSTPGWLAGQATDHDALLLKSNEGVATWIGIHDLVDSARDFKVDAPAQVGLGDSPYGDPRDLLLSRDGSAIVLTGQRSPDYCTNVGLSVFAPNVAPHELEAAACSEAIVRQPRVSDDGRWIVYLRDEAGLHVVGYDTKTGDRHRLTAAATTERGFVLRTM